MLGVLQNSGWLIFSSQHIIILLSRKSISSLSLSLKNKLKLSFGPCSFKAQKNPKIHPTKQLIGFMACIIFTSGRAHGPHYISYPHKMRFLKKKNSYYQKWVFRKIPKIQVYWNIWTMWLWDRPIFIEGPNIKGKMIYVADRHWTQEGLSN